VKLREFWDTRYATFELSESGWLNAAAGLNERIYACKVQALRAAIAAVGLRRDRPWSVLDGGCGQGYFARFYRGAFPTTTYVGVDISRRAIDHLRSAIPEFEFHAADLSAWDDPRGRRFDLVQSLEVLHLILDDDAMIGAMASLTRQLALGGSLLLTAVPVDQTVQLSDYLRHRSTAFWNAAFAKLGLRVIDSRPIYYWLPAGGPRNKYLRYALTQIGPGALYAIDRAAFGLGLPQPASAGIDSRMRLLTLQHA
jgi:SAM-dependent methyltransferase